jgi:uncharacterized protein (TIGR03118 family)
MEKTTKTSGFLLHFCFYLLTIGTLVSMNACKKSNEEKILKDFTQVNLVDNNHAFGALHTDPMLINAWGLTFTPNGIAWVNSQAGHVSALYDKDGKSLRPAITIPSPADTIGGNPTGIVFNGSTDFVLSNGKPGLFIFVGVDGVLSGWNGSAGNNAILIKNNAATSAYTGLTLATNGGANFLYAANFRTGKIDVWDKNFAPVTWMPFNDSHLPAGYSPFNIQIVGSWLYIMYAKVGPDGKDLAGLGNGFVDVFSTDGKLVGRFASKGLLNAPWGVTKAPASFFEDKDKDQDDLGKNGGGGSKVEENDPKIEGGSHEEDSVILVGNFGDGHISVFTISGKFIGQLKVHSYPLIIDGLWALSFAPSTASTIDPNRLYFTAGPLHESEGLFGYLIKQ